MVIIFLIYLVTNLKVCLNDPFDTTYNLIRSDHPSNTKHREVCLYYKNYLPLRVLNITNFKECLSFELKIGNKSLLAFIGPQTNLKTVLKPSLVTLK